MFLEFYRGGKGKGELRGFKGSLKQLCSLFGKLKILNLSGDQPTPRWPLDWLGVGYPQGIER